MNHKSATKIVLIIQLLLFTISSLPQSSSSPFILRTYTTQDGLPHSVVFSSMQDSRGYLWFGTFGGICRFDGQRFFNYIRNDEVKNLVVSCTYEDDVGRIWMYSGWSLYYMDHKNIYPFMSGEPLSLNLVYRDGDMTKFEWWAKTKQGVFQIGKNSSQSINAPPGLGDGYCRRIVETSKGYYYSDTTGLFFVANNGKKTSIEKFIPRTDFVVIIGYWNQKLYFYNESGVFVFNESGVHPLFINELRGKEIFTSYRDSKNRIWIATKEGEIFVSKSDNEEKLEYKLNKPIRWVTNFYEDNEGQIWIAFGEGLAKVEESKYESQNSNDFPFLTDLNTIGIDRNNSPFLFSETNGLINRGNKAFIWDKHNPFRGQLIDAFCFDEKNRAWCVSRQRKLLMYDNYHLTDFSNKISVAYNREFYLDINYDLYRKKIWIAADRLMIVHENEIFVFRSPDNQIITEPQLVLPLDDGRVLVLTTTNRLLVINKNNKIMEVRTLSTIIPQRIHKLFRGSSGDFWISYTGIGLLHCRIENDNKLIIIDKLTRENGLKNETIKSIAFDKKQHLWLATMTGISIVEIAEKSLNNNTVVFNFNTSNGLPENGLEYGRLVCDSSGDMWYSTQYYLIKFQANEIQTQSSPPKISIEDIQLNMQETNWSQYADSLSGFFQIPYDPVLKYYENTITINFKAVNMHGDGDLQNSYLLKGLNENWSSKSTNENVTLTKLPPGSYTFMVRARKTNSTWSEPSSFSFTIRPAIWQQWWFAPFLVVLFAGFIYWLYRFRITQIRKEERVRRRLASDLHDDIGSTLSSISYYSEAIRKQVNDSTPGIIPLLDKMEAASDNTVDAMSDIVWATNPSFDKGVDLLNRMRSYAADVYDL